MQVHRIGWLGCLVGLLAILCAGCLEVTQEVWINADGSGRLKMDLAMSEALVAMVKQGANKAGVGAEMFDPEAAKAELQKDTNVRKVEVQEFREAGMQHMVYDLELVDVCKLEASQRNILSRGQTSAADQSPSGAQATVQRLPNGNYRFVLVLTAPPRAAGQGPGDNPAAQEMGKAMAASMLAGKYFTVRLHGPIVSANGQVSPDKRLVEWKAPLADVLTTADFRQEMTAEVRGAPSLLWPLAVAGAVLIALLGLLASYVLLVRKKPAQNAAGAWRAS